MKDKLVLVVDDDPKIRALLRSCFEGEGARVQDAADKATVLHSVSEAVPDLIMLDLKLGGDDGFDVARDLRRHLDVPIIMVTGKHDVIDRIVGLELGADDYITKPFHPRELLARAKSVLRRYDGGGKQVDRTATPGADRDAVLRLDGLTVDLNRMSVTDRAGADCGLTTADFKLMRAFLEHPHHALSRDRLLTLIDGPEWAPLDRTIDNQVARLRKKIERDAADPRLIKTIRGVGYMLTEPASPADNHARPSTT